MQRPLLAAALGALAFVGACATATPYQAANGYERGFSEQKIESNRFQVEFAGNSLTDRKTVETYMLYRAAELTKQEGFDHFRVVRRDTDAETRLIGTGYYDPFYDHFWLNYRYFGPHAAYFRDPYRRYYPGPAYYYSRFGYYDPFWAGPPDYREQTSYVATAEIVMGKGPKPDDVAYFDADQVLFNLSGAIARPES